MSPLQIAISNYHEDFVDELITYGNVGENGISEAIKTLILKSSQE